MEPDPRFHFFVYNRIISGSDQHYIIEKNFQLYLDTLAN